MCYKSIHPWEGIHLDTSFILGTTENTNLTIGRFLAGLHRSPLTFLFAFLGFTDSLKINNARGFQPTDFWRTIKYKNQRLWNKWIVKKKMLHNKFFFKNMYNLHFIPNNILTIFFLKKLTKYKNDYQ